MVNVVCQDDESLRRWKEQLLGSVDLTDVGGILYFSHFFLFKRVILFRITLVITSYLNHKQAILMSH